MSGRNLVTEVYPRIFQRGKILTWPISKKLDFLAEHNIRLVVNLWTKSDPDLSESDIDAYYFLPQYRSLGMLKHPGVRASVEACAMYHSRTKSGILILCESGVTRSVFFTGLLLEALGVQDVLDRLNTAIPGHKMKDYMIEYFGGVV